MARPLPALLLAVGACAAPADPELAAYAGCEAVGERWRATDDGPTLEATRTRRWRDDGLLELDATAHETDPTRTERVVHGYDGDQRAWTYVDWYDDGTADERHTYRRAPDGRLLFQTSIVGEHASELALLYDPHGRVVQETVRGPRGIVSVARHRFTPRSDGSWIDTRQVRAPDGRLLSWEIATLDPRGRVVERRLDRWGDGQVRYETRQAWGPGSRLLTLREIGTGPRGVFSSVIREQDFDGQRLTLTYELAEAGSTRAETWTEWSYDCP